MGARGRGHTYDRDMQLEELEVIPYSLPFRDPYVTARGELAGAQADPGPDPGRGARGARRDGIPFSARRRGIESIADGDPRPVLARAARRRRRPRADLVGDRALPQPRRVRARRWRPSISPCTTWSGERPDEPVWRLLGASEAQPVVCNATLPAANPAATRVLAEEWARRGSGPSSSR